MTTFEEVADLEEQLRAAELAPESAEVAKLAASLREQAERKGAAAGEGAQ